MHHNDNKVNVCIQLLSIHEARLKKKNKNVIILRCLINEKKTKLFALQVFVCFCVKFEDNMKK